MAACCTNSLCDIEEFQARQSKTLMVVSGINTGMFIIEIVSGTITRSTTLLADSLDMFGDALFHGFSLYVLSRNET